MESAVIIAAPLALPPEKDEWVEGRGDDVPYRPHGVQQVKESKYSCLHAPRSALRRFRRLLPGSESPTIISVGRFFPDSGRACRYAGKTCFWETLES